MEAKKFLDGLVDAVKGGSLVGADFTLVPVPAVIDIVLLTNDPSSTLTSKVRFPALCFLKYTYNTPNRC